MKYKGFNINKAGKYIFHGFNNSEGYYWNVNWNMRNVHFDTLREAKDFINTKLVKNEYRNNQTDLLGRCL